MPSSEKALGSNVGAVKASSQSNKIHQMKISFLDIQDQRVRPGMDAILGLPSRHNTLDLTLPMPNTIQDKT